MKSNLELEIKDLVKCIFLSIQQNPPCPISSNYLLFIYWYHIFMVNGNPFIFAQALQTHFRIVRMVSKGK